MNTKVLLGSLFFIFTNLKAQTIKLDSTQGKGYVAPSEDEGTTTPGRQGVKGTNFSATDIEFETYPRPGLTAFDFNEPGKAESYPFISMDGLHLLYVHDQSTDWVFYCHRTSVSAPWSVPVPLEFEGIPELIGGYGDENGPVGRIISAAYYTDENTLFISGNWGDGYQMARFLKSESKEATYVFDRYIEFQNRDGVTSAPQWYSNISFCESFSEMYVYTSATTVCMKEVSDGVYKEHYQLGGTFQTVGKVMPDGLGFIGNTPGTHRGDLLLFKRENADQQFDIKEAYILYPNNYGLGLLQPAYCQATNTVFLVENKTGGWSSNNIYSVPVTPQAELPRFEAVVVEQIFGFDENLIQVPPSMELQESIPVHIDSTAEIRTMEHIAVVTENSGKDAYRIAIGRAFPNPTSGIFYIYYQSVSAKATDLPVIQINDLSGKTLHTMSLQPGNHSATVDISKLPAGTYSISAIIGGLQSPAERVVLIK